MLGQITEIARQSGAYILADEVYRGLNQQGSGTTASIADIYEAGISTGSMSKAFSLAEPAARVARRARRGDRGRVGPPRLQHHQCGHDRRLLREPGAGGQGCHPDPQPGNRPRQPRDPGRMGHRTSAGALRRSRGRAPLRCSDTTSTCRRASCAWNSSNRPVSCSPRQCLGHRGYLRIGYANPKILIEDSGAWVTS